MAIIGSIRKRGTLIVVVVGLSLAAFILGGAQNLFRAGNDTVGTFNGKKVNLMAYNDSFQLKKAFVATINPDAEFDEATDDALKGEVWEDIIRSLVFNKQFEKLGLKISDAEFNDMFVGETVDPQIRQQFSNEFGQFDPNRVSQYMQQFEDDSNIPEERKAQWEAQKQYWGFLQQKLRKDRLQNKYVAMVTKGLYVTTKESQSVYKANSDRANIRFVMKSYTTIADSTVTFTEDELVTFFKDYKFKMRSKKSKGIKYAVFLSVPTPADSAVLRTEMFKLKDELATSDDDTIFVAQNSDQSVPPQFVKKGVLSPVLDSLLFNAPKGTTAGPVIESGFYVIAKKLEERFQPDSVNVRHIIIQPKENTQEAVNAAALLRDSIFTAIDSLGASFIDMAAKFSMDGTAKDSGNVGWFGKNTEMDAIFKDSSFASKKGDLKKVNSSFGFHIIYVIDQTAPIKESQIAMVIRAIKPSEQTKQVQYNLATEMAYPDKKATGFDAVKHMDDFAKKHNIIYRDEPSLNDASRNILNMEDTKPVVKWVLGAKRGEISDVFPSGDNYIVAVVVADRPDGIPNLNDVREDAITAFRRHKKAEQFITEFNSALSSGKDINSVAAAMKLNVLSGQDISFGSYFVPGAGIEPELLGTAFGIKVNQLSKPIEGNGGVFVLVVDQVNPGAVLPDYTGIKNDMMRNMSNRAGEALNAVREKANIKDYRFKFDIF